MTTKDGRFVIRSTRNPNTGEIPPLAGYYIYDLAYSRQMFHATSEARCISWVNGYDQGAVNSRPRVPESHRLDALLLRARESEVPAGPLFRWLEEVNAQLARLSNERDEEMRELTRAARAQAVEDVVSGL